LGLYERYRRNFVEKRETLLWAPFTWGEERALVLENLDEADYARFLDGFNGFLVDAIREIVV